MRYFLRQVRAFFHRAIHGWADIDTWSFDYYLAKIIRDGVKFLKDTKCGYPMPEWAQPFSNLTDEEEKRAIAEWNSILDAIIYSYDMIVKQCDGSVYFWYEGCDETRKKLKFSYDELYKDVHFLTEEEQKKVELGQHLFLKHYHDLWS